MELLIYEYENMIKDVYDCETWWMFDKWTNR